MGSFHTMLHAKIASSISSSRRRPFSRNNLFRSLALGERHAVAAVVLDVGEHLAYPVMLLRVLAPVLELVAVLCIGIELCDGIGERGRCRENFFEAVGAYCNLFQALAGV